MGKNATMGQNASLKKKPHCNLNIRERKLIANIAKGMTPPDAMRAAGYKYDAVRKASEKVQQPRIKEAIEDLMDKAGVTEERMLQTLHEGLNANKIISAVSGKDAGGLTSDFIEIPDHDCRHKFLSTGLKLKGHLQDKRQASIEAGPKGLILTWDLGDINGAG